jgi:hypothetical protein
MSCHSFKVCHLISLIPIQASLNLGSRKTDVEKKNVVAEPQRPGLIRPTALGALPTALTASIYLIYKFKLVGFLFFHFPSSLQIQYTRS